MWIRGDSSVHHGRLSLYHLHSTNLMVHSDTFQLIILRCYELIMISSHILQPLTLGHYGTTAWSYLSGQEVFKSNERVANIIPLILYVRSHILNRPLCQNV